MGHTTAAVSAVVTAFMGGLATGAFLGGRFASRLTPRQALHGYVTLECVVALIALVVPIELDALRPVLAWSYGDGAPGLLFPAVRLLAGVIVIFIPALALGATFPLAAHWFVRDSGQIGRAGGALYAVNSAGAALGALAAGFVLIPALGLFGTTMVGIAAAGVAVAGALAAARTTSAVDAAGIHEPAGDRAALDTRGRTKRERRRGSSARDERTRALPNRSGLAALAVVLSGFAGLMYEVAWMRVFAMIVGPTTYAFAATVAAVIAGIAVGSGVAAWGAARIRRPALWLALVLALTAIAATYAASLAGGYVPRLVAEDLARSPDAAASLVWRSLLVAALILPAAIGFGAAFPLALALVSGSGQPAARGVGLIYASNTLAAVAGSLAAGFAAIPYLGLQQTLVIVSALLLLDAVVVILAGEPSVKGRVTGLVPAVTGVALMIAASPWDRDLLASGAYKYASRVPQGLDLETALKAGTLVYYREGAASTVSVKRLTGALSLAIDGKVDASSAGDMLTQKTLAHLPLLVHPNPREVCIIGLGSGVTLGSALVHPIARADIVEISPEVVEASRYFDDVNLHALDDPRTHLILGDGRSHLALSSLKYDVIISEPSNPWIAGVAALFTQEFFRAVRDRLAPGGIVAQWAHTYDISNPDLRSIVATFTSVFPAGTIWMVGEGDLLLVGSSEPLDERLGHLERSWTRPGVATDLARVSALEPFALLSMFAGGPDELRRYAAGAAIQTDDRQALEFSGPRALATRGADNASQVQRLLDPDRAPEPIRRALATAGAAEWRNRAAMLTPSDSVATAYGDYVRALRLNPADRAALNGLVRPAVATGRQKEALDLLQSFAETHGSVAAIPTAMSKLLAASGSIEDGIRVAEHASRIEPIDPAALEQLASVLSEVGDVNRLDAVARHMQRLQPERATTSYYGAAVRFLRGEFADAIGLAQQAVARDPQYAAAHNLLGAIYASIDNRSAARSAFTAALARDPRDPSIYTNLGLLELASANESAAAGYFAEALSLDPQSEAARRGLAQVRRAALDER
jgi:spermidine synthase